MNAAQPRLRGIIPPLVTPLDEGRVDRPALARLVDRVLAGGAAGVFVLGTTGEGPALPRREKETAIRTACEQAAGRAPVLVGISNPSFEDSCTLARFAHECGAIAVVATAPYYFPIAQRDLARYFIALAEAVPLPLYLYNMPACVRVSIESETLAVCTRVPNIAGVKDSSGDMAYFRRLLELRTARPDWSFLVGPEHLLAESVLAGGDGGVNGGANLAPELFAAQFAAADRRDTDEVARLQQQIQRLGQIYQVGDDFMAVARGIKCALHILGVCGDEMAPPFSACDAQQREAIASIVQETLAVTA